MLMFALLLTAIKAAVLLLILAGLIFRTKETAGLSLLFGMVKLFMTFPWPTTGVAVLILAVVCLKAIVGSPDKPETP